MLSPLSVTVLYKGALSPTASGLNAGVACVAAALPDAGLAVPDLLHAATITHAAMVAPRAVPTHRVRRRRYVGIETGMSEL